MGHLEPARSLTRALRDAVDRAAASLATRCVDGGRVDVRAIDRHQTLLYDLASVASATAAVEHLVADAGQAHLAGDADADLQADLALALAADVAVDLRARVTGREQQWGLRTDVLAAQQSAVAAGRDPDVLATIAERVLQTGEAGRRGLAEDVEMVRQTFRRFADERVRPVAERIHRNDEDIPEGIIAGLAELGCFALSIPTDYGGLAEGGEEEARNMVVVTEELSRGSLGAAGSLITRPEIVARAILDGGTEEQRQQWLPPMAAGEKMCAVAVTEPDVGSDVAGVATTATRDGGDWIINGVKTWCTFAGRAEYLLVLARTDPDRTAGHRGLSLFLVEKDAFPGHAWRAEQPGGGTIDARAIPTLGYRGMHSFEISFDGWRVPATALVGEREGEGRGFYLQMAAFSSGRVQTAARAQGVMQAALDETLAYARARRLFDSPLADYGLTRTKIARMAALLAGCRAYSSAVARQLARGEPQGQLEASQVKQFSCRVAEWVTREALQIHGGYGYAEEYTVSRLFVDARVLSIFEGADEVLALRVIARNLLQAALPAAR